VGAGEGLHTGVNPHVAVQPALVDKRFLALGTAEGAHRRVKLKMFLQVALDGEGFAAMRTHEGVPVDVDPGVVLNDNKSYKL
jgi:hypothetical protein